ncbi:MAG: hypothetical protein ACXVPD_05045 [Bacteroidia bacterium]
MNKLLLLLALIMGSLAARSQCTSVCGTVHIASGATITPSGTQTVTPASGSTFTVSQKAGSTLTVSATGSYTGTTAYSYVTVAGTNTITAGALSVSVSNVGSDAALFNGSTLPPGATINISIPNAILPQYTYNCLTGILMVLVNR